MNTFNKIKTFKYSKIFAWKYKTTHKAFKSNLNSFVKKKKKKAEVLGHRARRMPSDGSIVEFGALCLRMRKVVSFLTEHLYMTAVFPSSTSWKQVRLFVHLSPASLGQTNIHKPWVSCSSSSSFFCVKYLKKKCGIHNQTFFLLNVSF